ncbi:MAG: hypothetical protein AABW50_01415 [Nanoarchaeota archaeon]
MDQQKIVVVLLLITIILSIVTVAITLGTNVQGLFSNRDARVANIQNIPSQENGNVALEVRPQGQG